LAWTIADLTKIYDDGISAKSSDLLLARAGAEL